MHRHQVFNWLRRGKLVAASIRSSDPQRLAWVGVYPLDLSSPQTRESVRNFGVAIFPAEGRVYSLRAFEVDRKLANADVWLSEADLLNSRRFLAFNEGQLSKHLEAFGVAIESLEPPWKSDYPL